MKPCTTEKWTMKQISDSLESMYNGDKRIVVPRFQRGKRWKSEQENTFIDSLRKGYPVGTLLFYKTTENVEGKTIEVYTLVDGLQRSTAIHRYISKPMAFVTSNEIEENFVFGIADILGFPESQRVNLSNKIKEIFISFIQELKDLNNVQFFSLAKRTTDEIPVANKEARWEQLINSYTNYFIKIKSDYDTISNTVMPAVVYTGDENELPEIFNRINSKGTPLNPYEIYAASWPQNPKIKTDNDDIINYVLAKYDALNDDIYSIKDYSRDEIRLSKELTFFEYVFGFSKYISNKYSLLKYDTNLNPDEVSTIGFELLDACLFETKSIGEVFKKLDGINVNKLEKAIKKAIEFVDSSVRPVIAFKGNKRKDGIKPIYAKNQILSIIGYVFREMYSIEDIKHEREDWQYKKDSIQHKILLHFVYDIIRTEWKEGSGKLHMVINTKAYEEDISIYQWEAVLNNMFEGELKRKEIKNVQYASHPNLAFLNCIYLNKFTAMDQLSIDKFDIEHIATKDKMKKLILATNPEEGLPISSIANLCYLPDYVNRTKQANTFYQDEKYLKYVSLTEVEEKYSFTQKEDLDWIDLEYDNGDEESLKEFYLEFLRERFKKQKKEFYLALGIDDMKVDYNKPTANEKKKDSKPKKKVLRDNEMYDSLFKKISSNFKKTFQKMNTRGTIIESSDGNIGLVLSYSKMYPQGSRRKYWFAYHPNKIKELNAKEKYYVFACKDDNVALVLPEKELEENYKKLNVSDKDADRLYYHIVLFVNGENKISWLLSKPEIEDRDVSKYCLNLK